MKKLVFTQVRPAELWDAGVALGDVDYWDDHEAGVSSPYSVRWLVQCDDWYRTPAAGWIPQVCLVH
jgi:hypothetical protein